MSLWINTQNEKAQPERLPGALTLLAWRVEDAGQYHAVQQFPAAVDGNPHVRFESVGAAREYIETLDPREIAIAAKVDDPFVGEARLTPFKGRRGHAGSLAIGVHDGWQRRGIGNLLMTGLPRSGG